MKINWNFLRGGGCKAKKPSMGEYGYFLELHISPMTKYARFSIIQHLFSNVFMFSDSHQYMYI